jgi:3-carboxy-cis,cis-muconate cycloisomerase
LTSNELFAPLFGSERTFEQVSAAAWIRALLAFEAELAAAEAEVGAIPSGAATAIGAACEPGSFDPFELGRAARASGNPVVPLVSALRSQVAAEHARWVHFGATSQDALDTAAMLVARGALESIDDDLEEVAAHCAELAERHRSTPMVARTLLRQALPTTFGLKAAQWLSLTIDAREDLARLRGQMPLQLAGAAGTMAALGSQGPAVAEALAQRLGLARPVLPWHTDRRPVATLGASLAIAAQGQAKIATDVVLMAQDEVGELAERAGDGRGGSSALPQKRNAIGSVLAIACAERAAAASATLIRGVRQENERAAGAWHAEWPALVDVLDATGGAVARMREVLEALEVDDQRMRRNLERAGGALLSERVAAALAEHLDPEEAHELVAAAARRAADDPQAFAKQLLAEPGVSAAVSAEELEALLDPTTYLGAAQELTDAALARHRASEPK